MSQQENPQYLSTAPTFIHQIFTIYTAHIDSQASCSFAKFSYKNNAKKLFLLYIILLTVIVQ